jgi:hypothetical protein
VAGRFRAALEDASSLRFECQSQIADFFAGVVADDDLDYLTRLEDLPMLDSGDKSPLAIWCRRRSSLMLKKD